MLRTNIYRFTHSASILVIFTLFLLGLEFNVPAFFSIYFNKAYEPTKIAGLSFYVAFTMVCFLIIPLLFSRIFYNERAKNLGLRLPKNKIEATLLTLLSMAILMPMLFWLVKQKSIQAYYSLYQPGTAKLIFSQLIIFPLYYFCEEFFFRGFLLLNLWQKVRWHSIWIVDIIFAFSHITKPMLEILMAIPVGIVFGCLALRTRSIYPSVFIHFVMGMVMILAVNHVI